MVTPSDVSLDVLTDASAPAMYRWMQDTAVREGIGLKSEPSLEKTRAWLERAASDASVRAFAVTLRGEHVGNVVLDEIDAPLGSGRLSVYIGEVGARRMGVGKAAVALAVARGFEELGLRRIWLKVHARNDAAVAIYEALGFVFEGRLRDAFPLGGEHVDALLMGILAPEWRWRLSERAEGGAGRPRGTLP
jgi:RimJ/RimL family protein N-acetyltransferase